MIKEIKVHVLNNSKRLNELFAISMTVFAVAVFVSFVTAPLTGDIKVFIAAANQVQYKDLNGLKAIFEAWELKGIGNRILMYVLYQLTKLFVTYGHVTQFEIVVKFIYAIIIITFCAGTAFLISDNSQRRMEIFLIEYFAVMATYTISHLQAEMTGVMLALAAMACYVNGKRWSVIVAGVFGSLLLFFKSIFIILFFVALLGGILYKGIEKINKREILWSILVMSTLDCLFFAFIFVYYPQEFNDMAMAAEFQSTLFSKGAAVSWEMILNNFINNFMRASVMIPFIFIGVACTIIVVIQFIKKKKCMEIILLAFSWIFTIDLIVVSNMYFYYHYFLLILPAVISLLICIKAEKISKVNLVLSGISAFVLVAICWLLKDGNEQTGMINSSTVLLVVIHVLLLFLFVYASEINIYFRRFSIFILCTVSVFFWMNYSSIIAPKYRNARQLLINSEEICQDVFPSDFSEEPVLFLDAGVVPFYIDAPSYSRYFFNLPMQRWNEGDDWIMQKSEYEKLMRYDGKYIVYSEWFGLDKYPELKQKISSEYEVLEDTGIYTYGPDVNMYGLESMPDVQSIRKNKHSYLMVRKSK